MGTGPADKSAFLLLKLFSRLRRDDFRYTKTWERERDDFQDFRAPGLLCEQNKKRSSKCIWIEDSREKSIFAFANANANAHARMRNAFLLVFRQFSIAP